MSYSPTGRQRWVFVLAIVLAAALIALAGIGATESAEPDVGVGTEPTADVAAVDERAGSDDGVSATIEPALRDGSGDVDVLVRFAEADEQVLSTSTDARRTLQTHAATEQDALERYAESTDGVTHHRRFWITNAALVTVDREVASLSELAAVEGVVALTENYETKPASAAASQPAPSSGGPATGPTPTASGPEVGTQSHVTSDLAAINAPDVWETFDARGAGTSVAVLDTGVDPSHPDIDLYTEDPDDPTYPGGWAEFTDGGDRVEASEPYAASDHGTHVSGTVAGGDASGTAIGVAPETRLLHGKVLGEEGGTMSAVFAGMEWAIDAEADVISMSLGTSCERYSTNTAVQNARQAGVVTVASIGNDGEGCTGSPGNVYDVVGVGATTTGGSVWEGSGGAVVDTESAWGSDAPRHWPDEYVTPSVVAPGVGVYSAVPGGYETKTGTSMAAPHVSGTIALMQSATDRELGPDEIEAALRETAWKPDGAPAEQDVRYGDGVVDAYAAVDDVATTVTLTGTVTDGVTGAPIGSATVTVGDREVTTADDGTYAIEGIDGGSEYAVSIGADGYERDDEDRFIGADDTTVHDVSLSGDATIEVEVTDSHFGEPIEDGVVEAESTARERYPGTYDGDGTYTIPDVPSSDLYDVTATAAGYQNELRQYIVTEPGVVAERVSMTGSGSLQVSASDAVTGAAIDGATVTVTREDGATFDAPGETDADGDLDVAVPGTETAYDVSVGAEGYHDAKPASVTTAAEEDGSTAVELTGDAAVELDVTDAHFADGIADAAVTLSGTRGAYEGVHESDGTYRIEHVPSRGSYDLAASAVGYESDAVEVDVADAGATTVDPLALAGDATLEVVATDAVTGAAIDGATVTVGREDGATFDAPGETDADGTLSVTVPGTGVEYDIETTAAGYEGDAGTTPPVATGGEESITVDLSGDAAVELDVTDAHFAGAVGDATVEAGGEQGTYPGTATDDGTFVVDSLPSESAYEVTIAADGYASEAVTLTVADPGATALEPVALSGDGALTVSASDAVTGTAIDGATVTVTREDGATFDAPGETDADGNLDVVVPGTASAYDVSVGAGGYETTVETAPVGAVTDVALAGDAAIEIDVLDAHFADGIADAAVEASGDQGTYEGSHETGGTYVIEAVPSVGSYDLTASAAGYDDGTAEFDVTDAGTTTVDPLALAGDATLEVVVASAGTEPITDATVAVERPDGSAFEVDDGTDADGEVTVAVPGTGDRYTVSATVEGDEGEGTTGAVGSGATESVTATVASTESAIPGFGVGAAGVAVIAVGVGLAARRATTGE